eukprot:GHVS01053430.1.p2 GENE.GHVS01053430.1~~GHVS01053430.1.p2  ORF type:complete len:139 (-),score=8.94 GHVS01053430.1:642-1058(-)
MSTSPYQRVFGMAAAFQESQKDLAMTSVYEVGRPGHFNEAQYRRSSQVITSILATGRSPVVCCRFCQEPFVCRMSTTRESLRLGPWPCGRAGSSRAPSGPQLDPEKRETMKWREKRRSPLSLKPKKSSAWTSEVHDKG